MNFLDWIGLGVLLTTMLGAQVTPKDDSDRLEKAVPAQVQAGYPTASAGVAVGGDVIFLLADSGEMAASERAIAASERIRTVVGRYDLPKHYTGLGLRVGGGGDKAEIAYFDSHLLYVTRTDARLNKADSPRALADAWRNQLDRALKVLPTPLPDSWIATTGEVSGLTMVPDDMLARAVAGSLSFGPGDRVSASVAGGMVTLEGKVTSETQHRRVVRLAGQVPGVRGVVDHLSVTP